MGKKQHLHNAPEIIHTGIMTVSSSRGEKEDKSGRWIRKLAEKEGHRVAAYRIVKDERYMIARTAADIIRDHALHALIVTGGTGISPADVTIEAIRPMFVREMNAFATLFARLSFEQVDSAALLSRAAAGIIGTTVVFCIPGNLNACKLACKELIFPEIKHIAAHLAG